MPISGSRKVRAHDMDHTIISPPSTRAARLVLRESLRQQPMRIPVCVLRNHKPRHPSACYRQACTNQHHASNSKYKCFGRGARTAATFVTGFERPPRRTIRDRGLVTSAGTVVLQVSNADKFVGERLWCVLKLPNRKDCR